MELRNSLLLGVIGLGLYISSAPAQTVIMDHDSADQYAYNDAREDYQNPYANYQQLAYSTDEFVAPSRHNTFIFDPRKHKWFAYNHNGELVGSGRASGGKGYCPDIKRRCKTPVGSFKVYSKGGPGCVSSKYPVGKGGAPMPYCMFFRGGYAIHGSNHVPNHNASHGCIRVEPDAARWLSKNVIHHGTKVIVRPY